MNSTRPTGTITFLFTDIEGSTRLWQAAPEAMTAALRRHDDILLGVLTATGGHVFKTVGDAFCCAFATAHQAIEGALAVHRNLAAERWAAEIGALKVRVAIHTGTADERNGDYFGPTLNRIARILSAGHGGQILLSEVTAALVRDRLPIGVTLRDLGTHRLKDLDTPQTIHQLLAEDLPQNFPPLRTADPARHNLPAQATPLIGRRAQVEAVLGLLRRPDVRLITLTGVGGTGKTRLSLQVAAELVDEYEHGVYFIDLAQVTEPDGIAPAIISTLGIAAPGREDPQVVVERYAAARHMLLILDNFEQVVRGAPVVTGLLQSAPRLEILVTSRELLRITGEREYAVPPLTLPKPDALLSRAEYLQYEAVALFVERAQAGGGDFALTEENARTVSRIVARLDGLPLAIELAAARTRLFTPRELLLRLEERLDALGRGMRDRPERHQTLRGAIDWSYNLLDEEEQALFRRLSVFSGGWEIDAAEAVCGGDLPLDVIDGLESLLNKSLIRRVEGDGPRPRFAMLVTIGEYAREQLAMTDEAEAVHRRHAGYFHDLADTVGGKLRQRDQLLWLARLNAEHDNLRVALEWLLGGGDAGRGVAMAAALRDFWLYTYRHDEGETWLRRAIDLAGQADPAARVDALIAAGMVTQYRNRIPDSVIFHEAARTAAAELGDPRRIAWNSMWLAVTYMAVPASAEEMPELLAMIRKSVETLRRIDDKPGISQGLNIMGENLRVSGDLDAAEAVYLELIPIAEEIGDYRRVVFQYANLSTIAFERRDAALMLKYIRSGLPISVAYRVDETVTFSLIMIAVLAYWNGHHDTAARLIGAAEAWYEEMSVVPQAADMPVEVRMIAEVRRGLDERAYHKGWEAGHALSLAEAVDEAEREITLLAAMPAMRTTGGSAA